MVDADRLQRILELVEARRVDEARALVDGAPDDGKDAATSTFDAAVDAFAAEDHGGPIAELAKRLDTASLPELVARARRLGVATPEDGVLDLPHGTPAWEKRSRRWLRGVIVREASVAEKVDPARLALALEGPAPGSWANYTGRVAVVASREVFRPDDLWDVLGFLERCRPGDRVKAVAAGHAADAVAEVGQATGRRLLVSMDQLLAAGVPWEPADVGPGGWRVQVLRGGDEPIVRVSAGMSVADANRVLANHGYALRNAGSYDRQHLAGAFCTGTHGSGGSLPPIADELVSIDVATIGEDGRPVLVRVERADGPTVKAAFDAGAAPHVAYRWRLVQDDDLFRALLVSFGAMGLVTSVAVRVRRAYDLRETADRMPWSKALDAIRADAGTPGVRLDVLLDPYHKGDVGVDRAARDFACHVSRRVDLDVGPGEKPDRKISPLMPMFRRMGPSSMARPRSRAGARSQLVAVLDFRGPSPGTAFRSSSAKVLRLGAGQFVTCESCEVAIELPRQGVGWDVRPLDALVRSLSDVVEAAAVQGAYTFVPTGIRFVRGSEALLSFAAGRPDAVFATLEFPVPIGRASAWTLVGEVCDRLTAEGARPHWGQVLPPRWRRLDATGVVAELGRMWGAEALRAWHRALTTLDPQGYFANEVTERVAARSWGSEAVAVGSGASDRAGRPPVG